MFWYLYGIFSLEWTYFKLMLLDIDGVKQITSRDTESDVGYVKILIKRRKASNIISNM